MTSRFKKCSNCFKVKPWGEFYMRKRPTGETFPQSRCKVCNAEVCAGWKLRAHERLNAFRLKAYQEAPDDKPILISY